VAGKLKTLNRSQLLWCSSLALLLLSPASPALARVHKSDAWARTQFDNAQSSREALNELPAEERTRHEYQNVIRAYRRVYFSAPSSGKADPSIAAVAELLMEMGRQFNDTALMRSAIRQYEFLRREYPGSRERVNALLTIGEIYKDDLNDPARANEIFEEFLRRYSHSPLAGEARANLSPRGQPFAAGPTEQPPAKSTEIEPRSPSEDRASAPPPIEKETLPSPGGEPSTTKESAVVAASAKLDNPSRVTGIRHWSLPDGTRVAIDLDQETRYRSQHLSDPDRVFFDLQQTKLTSALVGKTFDVDDGVLKKIRMAQYKPGQARIVLEVEAHADYHAYLVQDPPRLMIDIRGPQATESQGLKARSAAVSAEEAPPLLAENSKLTSLSEDALASPAADPMTSQTAIQLTPMASEPAIKKRIVEADDDDQAPPSKAEKTEHAPANKAASTSLPASNRKTPNSAKASVVDSRRKAINPSLDIREARPTAGGDRSLIRALGLKIGKIVIDPGHGGHDTGTIGPNGLEEKDLVLDVSRRLGKLLDSRLGAEVVYTRKDDTFIPLETRTSIANQEQADLFVSVHANSSHDPDARGVETYYLNFTSSPQALEVAARENAVSEKSIHELQDLVKKIALKEKIEESHEFASDVQQALHSGLAAKNPGIRDRGVKKAPFIVLIGANMPSILAEISFVSNPGDEHHLESAEYRQRIAESLYRGISRYVSGLSGVKVASRIDRATGQ
jgi:N-acetylmuramoyl-L-alanine amidase